MFTPAIFKETFRRSIKAWGYHGFLQKKKKSKGDKELVNNIRNYHAELREVLASFRNATPHLEGIVLRAIKTNSVPRFQACHKLIHSSLQLPADYHCQSTNHSVRSSSNLQCSVAVCGQTTIAHACFSDETDLMRT